jgi:hypothetical protein
VQLDVAARTLESQTELLRSPVLATLSRPDSPMRPDELVPSILGSSVSEMRRCLDGIREFSGDAMPKTLAEAIRLIEWPSLNGMQIRDAQKKLRLLQEFAYDTGNARLQS